MKYSLSLILYLCLSMPLLAQTNETLISGAMKLVEKGEYPEALRQFEFKDITVNPKALFYKAYCHFKLRQLDKAEETFLKANQAGYQAYDIYFLMAQIRHAEGEYDHATVFYKKAFKEVAKNSADYHRIINALKSCMIAEKMEFEPTGDVVINLGSGINSYYDETNPLPSPSNEGLFYFSSTNDINDTIIGDRKRADRNANIYKTFIQNNEVMSVELANEKINSSEAEYLLDATDDGQVLYYLIGEEKNEVYTDTFASESIQKHQVLPLELLIRSSGACDLDVFQDSIFIFASDKPGGYGGSDLYFSLKRDSIWMEGVNFGPEVNSPYDEVTPYLSKDGRKLFFSSNRVSGLGGYDIYRSSYSEIERKWSTAKNLKTPINSTQDEIDFKVSAINPSLASFASNRLIDNLGGYDIYKLILEEPVWKYVPTAAPLFFTAHMDSEYTDKIFKYLSEKGVMMPVITEPEVQDTVVFEALQDSVEIMSDSLEIATEAARLDSIAQAQADLLELSRMNEILDSMENVRLEEERLIAEKAMADSLEMARINQESLDQAILDSLNLVQAEEEEILRAKAIQDSIAFAKYEEERMHLEKARKDSLELVRIENARILRAQQVQDSIEQVRLDTERAIRIQFVKDSLAQVAFEEAKIKREQEIQDSIAQIAIEEARLKREAEVQDSLEQVAIELARIQREQETQDSIAQVAIEEARLKRESEIRDSLEQIATMEREQFLADSLAEAELINRYKHLVFTHRDPDSTITDLHVLEMAQMVDFMNSYPDSHVEIEGFASLRGPSIVYDLFNALKLAEAFKTELIVMGANPDRISIKGHGAAYNDSSLATDDQSHNRLVTRIFQLDLADHVPNMDAPFEFADTTSNYYNDYLSKNMGISFKVEGIQMRRMLANRAINDFSPLMIEQMPGSRNYSYIFGNYSSIEDAIIARRDLVNYNLRSPVIYAYLNGSRITEQQARFMADDNEELAAFVRYLDR